MAGGNVFSGRSGNVIFGSESKVGKTGIEAMVGGNVFSGARDNVIFEGTGMLRKTGELGARYAAVVFEVLQR
ncbi:hypothetical protein F0562_028889 [Nyssa sinensis]|uniref:Uncharacterized protein n=1 Tax=Nyssa sinensis TaxID=561372 RepID=A0A5J5B5I9_9ASTE|nr:hypothetical protein F0562_028889 [Nyssa sinensis]